MFKKKPTVKSLTQIRSSDRRKLADQIISDFGLNADILKIEDEAVRAAATIQLRNSLLPESSQAARFSTTAGPDLKPILGTLYVGPLDDTEGPIRVLWVKLYERIYPTVTTLWRHPRIVPLLHTPEAVVEKIQGGASLMTPGLADKLPFPKGATKNAIVAIASYENPSVPVAVGTCVIDISSLTDVHGSKGHAVEPLQWTGDEIWSWSTTGAKGLIAPEQIPAWLSEGDGEEATTEADDLEVPRSAENTTVNPALDDLSAATGDGGDQVDKLAEGVEELDVDQAPPRSWSQNDVDRAFHDAFVYGIHHHIKHSQPARLFRLEYPYFSRPQRNAGIEFPLSQSSVMSTLIQPFLPIYGPSDADALTIKKSSWKNMKKFIRQLAKEKIVKIKEQGNSEVVILEVDFNHVEIVNFAPLHMVPKNNGGALKFDKNSDSTNNSDQQTQQQATALSSSQGITSSEVKISIFYRPKPSLIAIFPTTDSRTYLTRAEIQAQLNAYIVAEKLVIPSDRGVVKLDPVLWTLFPTSPSAVGTKGGPSPFGTVNRALLVERVLAPVASPSYWLVHPSNQTPAEALFASLNSSSNAKPKLGSPPRISITLETRGSNKATTRLVGLEAFGIRAQALADELRRACAASTSVEKATGIKKNSGPEVWEVMVQGQRTNDVLTVLASKFGVKEEWVDIVQKLKKANKSASAGLGPSPGPAVPKVAN